MHNPYQTPSGPEQDAVLARIVPPAYAWMSAGIVHLGCAILALAAILGLCVGLISNAAHETMASAVVPPLVLLGIVAGLAYVQFLAVFRANRLAAVLLGMLFGLFAVLGFVDSFERAFLWMRAGSTIQFDGPHLVLSVIATLMLGALAGSMFRWSRALEAHRRIV